MDQYVVPGLGGTSVAVTGGASGMGLETALLAARSGARVVVGDLNEDALAEAGRLAAAEQLSIECVRLDVSDDESAAAFVATAASDASMPLKGVVCAAGIAPHTPVLEMTREQWDRMIAVVLTGTFLVTRDAARAMVGHGGGGSIVNISASNANFGHAGLAHYTAAKAGVIAYTKTLARELGRYAIRVNSVAPGAINTPLARSLLTPEELAQRAATFPLPRIGEPDDIAQCVGFFLSDRSPWITGQTVYVNGGMVMP